MLQVERTGAHDAALAYREIKATVLHHWIKQRINHPAEALNLVDEQQIDGLLLE